MHKNVTKPLTRKQEVHQQRNEQLRQRRKKDPIEEFCEYEQFLHSVKMYYEELCERDINELLSKEEKLHRRRMEDYEELKRDPIQEFCEYELFLHSVKMYYEQEFCEYELFLHSVKMYYEELCERDINELLSKEEKLHRRRMEDYEELKRDPIKEFCEYKLFLRSERVLRSERAEMDYEELYYYRPDDDDYDDAVRYRRYRLWKEKRKHDNALKPKKIG